MELSIKTNGYSVISAGVLFLYDNESECKMGIVADNGFKFEIVFRFVSNTDKKHSMDKAIEGNTIILKCTNFNDPLGVGTVKPLSIATIAGKEVFLHFWTYNLGENATRKIEYTFLQKE